jgi:hypothetical protein
MIELPFTFVYIYLALTCALGFFYGVFNWMTVKSINTSGQFSHDDIDRKNIRSEHIALMNETSEKIQSVISN